MDEPFREKIAIAGRLVLIATHHKTGTVWMRQLFQAIARRLGWRFVRLADDQRIDTAELRARSPLSVLFQDHGRFHPDLSLEADDRGWHLLRDPRDVLISGANYHSWSDEPWLHQPRDNLDGLSYQQALRTLSFSEAVRFEMDRSTGQAVRDMLAFDRRGGCFRDIAYETLLEDATGAVAEGALGALGLGGESLAVARAIFRDQHPLGRREERPRLRAHIQNLDTGQWRYMYDPDLLATFEARFPDAAPTLGYPRSDPALLIDDRPRREAYLARTLANRGDTRAALARLEAALQQDAGAPVLIEAHQLIRRCEATLS